MKTKSRLVAVAAFTLLAWGCANHRGVGNAPGVESGRIQSEAAFDKERGERFPTETLLPGVGSALFPDPGWR